MGSAFTQTAHSYATASQRDRGAHARFLGGVTMMTDMQKYYIVVCEVIEPDYSSSVSIRGVYTDRDKAEIVVNKLNTDDYTIAKCVCVNELNVDKLW